MKKLQPRKQYFDVVLEFNHQMTRTVKVGASSREVAERRALKRNPTAKKVKRA